MSERVAWNAGRPEHPGQSRIAPRECMRAAHEAICKAYGVSEGHLAYPYLRDAVDWLRRGLEQMSVSPDNERLLRHIHRIDHRAVVPFDECDRCDKLRKGAGDA